MSFLVPAALALGLLALLVLALHGNRARRVAVSGLLIWRVLEESRTRAAPAWRVPQPSLPLILQILAIVLLALALARPVWGENRDVEHWVLVIDNAAPISVTETDLPRFAAALAHLTDFGDAATGQSLVSVITTNARAEPLAVRQDFTRAVLDHAVAAIAPGEARADWDGVGAILDAVLRADETSRVVLISAAPPPLDALGLGEGVGVDSVAVGAPLGNAGLSADLLALEPEAGRWRAEGQVTAANMDLPPEVSLTFIPQGETETVALPSIALDAGDDGVARFAADLDLPGPGRLDIAVPEDAGAFDNHARFVVRDAPRQRNVLHIGPDDQPLVAALQAVGGVSVTTAGSLPDDAEAYDLAIIADPDMPAVPGITTLRIAPGSEPGVSRPIDWDESHPLTAGIDWRGLAAESAAAREPGPGETVLLGAADRPLITVSGREIRLGFDPARSNWPEGVALPLFAANLLDWLGPLPGAGWLEPVCIVGTPCRIDAALVGGTRAPEGAPGTGVAILTNRFVPDRAGLYLLENGTRSQELTVNPAPHAVVLAGAVPASDTAHRPVELTRWLIGLAIAVLALDTILAAAGRERGPWLALRGVGLAVMVAALIDPAIFLPGGRQTVVAVLDADVPVPQADGLVWGGVVRDTPEGEVAVPFDYTDPDLSLRLGAGMLPPEGGTIVLASNAPPAMLAETVAAFRGRDVTLDILAPSAPPGDVAVEILQAPAPLYAGDRFLLTAVLHAQAATSTELTVLRDGEPLLSVTVDLVAGANRIDLPMFEHEAGAVHYQMIAASPADTVPANDRFGLWADIASAPRVAVISEDPEPRATFVRMLAQQGFDAVDLTPGRLPIRIEVYENYDAVVLLDMRAIALETRQMNVLEQAVREKGLGLLILGGPHSFGPGGYIETPLEVLSPLSSRLPHDAPEVALAFVLDSSGSMSQTVGGQTRLDLSKYSVRTAVDLLDAQTSSLGIIMFSSDADVVLPLQPVPDAQTLDAALAAVQPGGGTAIYPALEVAYEQLRASDAAAKHVVVMTDGMSDPADFPFLLARIREAGITVSAVAIGSTAETNIAEDIALLGGGRFHATADFEALPSILSQETLMLAGDPVDQGTFGVLATGTRPDFMEGLPDVPAPVGGYVQTTAKPDAQIVWMAAPEDDEPVPLLASWRYGTGNVLALATAATGVWTRSWQATDDFPRLFAQALRQFLPAQDDDPVSVDIARIGDVVAVTARVGDGRVPMISARDPEGESRALEARVVAPGLYRASFVPHIAGTHEILVETGQDTSATLFDMGFSSAWSRRHDMAGLSSLSAATGGRIIESGAVLAERPTDRWTETFLRPLWLALALGLLLLDLLWRYRGRRKSIPQHWTEKE